MHKEHLCHFKMKSIVIRLTVTTKVENITNSEYTVFHMYVTKTGNYTELAKFTHILIIMESIGRNPQSITHAGTHCHINKGC